MVTSLEAIQLTILNWINKIWDIALSIVDFFVLLWNDEDRWWCIGGLVVVIIFVCKIVLLPVMKLFGRISFLGGGRGSSNDITVNGTKAKCHSKRSVNHMVVTVTIKGVYQMNGPKPFTRIIECSPSETGYYSQLMSNKSKQAQWIQANFPGANIGKGFSMSVNIR